MGAALILRSRDLEQSPGPEARIVQDRERATARKGLPDVDVAKAGGWSSLQALQDDYIQSDDETVLQVVEHEAELREVR